MTAVTSAWSVRSITRTLLPVVVGLTLLELIGGLALEAFETTLLRYPSLLVLVPVTIGTAGNLGSVLSARLSTALHLGLVSLDRPAEDERLVGYSAATLLLAVSVFPLVGAGGWAVVALTGTVRLPLALVVGVALASGIVLAIVAVAVTVGTVYAAYRLELDPDDVVLPVVTNLCDVLGVFVLVGVVRVLVT